MVTMSEARAMNSACTAHEMKMRQRDHFRWAQQVFGNIPGVDVMSPRTRALRMLEEAIELYQAVTHGDGLANADAQAKAQHLVEYVFNREVGVPKQEAGGLMVTLMSLCERIGIDLDDAERTEAARIATVDVNKLRAKQLAKIEAGVEL